MIYKLKIVAGMTVAICILLCTACSARNQQGGLSAASISYEITSVGDLANDTFLDLQIIARMANPGSYTVDIGDGGLTRAALANYEVLQVLRGDPSLEGKIICIREVFVSPLLAVSRDIPICASLEEDMMLLCIHHESMSDWYVIHQPNQIIPIGEDGSINFDPAWPDAEDYTSISEYVALFDESDLVSSQQLQLDNSAQIVAQHSSASESTIPGDTLSLINEWLNETANNGFVRSEYVMAFEADLDAVLETLTLNAGYDASDEQVFAYFTVTGKNESELVRLPNNELLMYLQIKTGCDATVFKDFTWVYLEQYNSWFAPKGGPSLIPVRCTGGSYLGDEYQINYVSTNEAYAPFISGTITLYNMNGEWRVLSNTWN